MNDAAREFWNKQTDSLHRSDDEKFYDCKAVEHASLMLPNERSAGCVDLGCGAGELLFHLMDHVNIRTGIDYARSMLEQAEKILAGKGIELLNVDIFEYLPQSDYPVWTTTGAINQYLDPQSICAFLDVFTANNPARSLFLFDCVDPLRYSLMPYGISYRPRPIRRGSGLKSFLQPAHLLARRWLLSAELALGLFEIESRKLRSAGMGFAYSPLFWIDAAAARNIKVDVVSSRFYEYRYHVIMRKISA